MTNAEILTLGLAQFASSLYPESIHAAAQHARIQDLMARKNVLVTLQDLKEMRATGNKDKVLMFGVKEVLRQQLRTLRVHRKVRCALVRVNRALGKKRSSAGPVKPNELLKKQAQALSCLLTPYLVPPQLLTIAEFDKAHRATRKYQDYTTEHVIAEDWLVKFPELFMSWSLNPPLCVPPSSIPPQAQMLFNNISDNMVLTKTEERYLHQALLGRPA